MLLKSFFAFILIFSRFPDSFPCFSCSLPFIFVHIIYPEFFVIHFFVILSSFSICFLPLNLFVVFHHFFDFSVIILSVYSSCNQHYFFCLCNFFIACYVYCCPFKIFSCFLQSCV